MYDSSLNAHKSQLHNHITDMRRINYPVGEIDDLLARGELPLASAT
jgi:hypothetical protein